MHILIMGAGNIGQALGQVLQKKKGMSIEFWDAVPGMVKKQRWLSQAVPEAEAVFFCLPSFAVREAAKSVGALLKKRTPVICVSKGIENETFLTTDKLLAKVLPPRQPFAVLFGPMLALELAAGAPGYAIAAGAGRKTAVKIFKGTNFIVSESNDLSGVALCGALKNIYALGLGILAALKTNDNVLGAYLAATHREMGGIVKILGGQAETVSGLAGLGDLVATGFSANSKNRNVGMMIGRGEAPQRSEGTRAVHSLERILGWRSRRFPVLRSLHLILEKRSKPSALLAAVNKSLCLK